MKKTIICLLALVLCMTTLTSACAEWKWNQRVEILVPGGEGGGLDTTVRKFSTYLDDVLGTDISIINKGNPITAGYTYAHTSSNEGFSFQFTAPSSIICDAQGMFTDFKLMDEIIPVSGLVQAEGILFCGNNVPWDDAQGMIEYAKAHPKKVTIGIDSVTGIAGAIIREFEEAAGIELRWITSDVTEGFISVISGDLDMCINTWSDAGAYAESGDLQALLVLADQRNPAYENIPCTGELGIDNTLGFYRVFTAMKGTPQEAIDAFAAAVNETAQNPEWIDWLSKNGMTNDYLWNAEELGTVLNNTYEKALALSAK